MATGSDRRVHDTLKLHVGEITTDHDLVRAGSAEQEMNVADVPERSWSRWDLDVHKTDGAKFSALGERGAPHGGEAVRRRSDEQGVEPVSVWRLRPRWWGENVTWSAPTRHG